MFDNLTARLARTVDNLRGRGRITEDNIGESLREVRMALLEADVALPVVKTFIERVKAKALGAEVTASLTPGQAFIGILHKELVELMGGAARRLQPARAAARRRAARRPAGRGQDHHRGKLARWLIEREEARVAGEHGRPPPRRDAAARASRRAGGRASSSRSDGCRRRREHRA